MNKRSIFLIIIGFSVSMIYYVGGIVLPGLEIIVLPSLLILFLVELLGIFIIPTILIKLFRKDNFIKKWEVIIASLSIGLYLSLIFQIPINNWDREQRNYSGRLVSSAIEEYEKEVGNYPENLLELNRTNLNTQLPFNYQLERFGYLKREDKYRLYIDAPIFNRWEWNRRANGFNYVGL